MTKRRALLLLLVLAVGVALACRSKGPHSVTLRWQESKPRPGSPLAGYNVYRRTEGQTQYIKVAGPVAHPPYEDRLVVSGDVYYYSVTAVDISGRESRLSGAVRAAIP